ncbi:MAG: 50S ribosomal protein L17 [Patescibacteria group bacterium]
MHKGRKFGLKKGPRRSFLRILANNLVSHEKITTTEARAKELKGIVERYITYGKQQNLAGMKLLLEKLPKAAAYKVYHEIAPRYKERKGGYTRVVKTVTPRKHDGSKMAVIEFVK